MDAFSDVVLRALARVEAQGARLPSSREIRAAIALVEDLRGFSVHQRNLLARNRSNLQTVAVAERLLEVAKEEAYEDPRRALEWLDTLDVVLDSPRLDAPDWKATVAAELTPRACAARAMNLIRLDNFSGAHTVLQVLDRMEVCDPMTVGEIQEAWATYYSYRRDLPNALVSLSTARAAYEAIEDYHLVGRVELRAAIAHHEAGESAPAIHFATMACELLDARREPRLLPTAIFNLARYLRDAGHAPGALSVLGIARDLFERRARKSDRLRFAWLEADLLSDQGHHEEAATRFQSAVVGFAEIGHGAEAAIVATAAVESLLRSGRLVLALPMLAAAVQVLEAAGLSTDALSAWILLQRSVAEGVVTAAILAEVRKRAATV